MPSTEDLLKDVVGTSPPHTSRPTTHTRGSPRGYADAATVAGSRPPGPGRSWPP